MKLTSSKNFGKTLKDKTDSKYRRLRDNFDNFLEHALHLGMFVPTDEAGNVLEEPIDDSDRGRCEYDLLKKLTFKEKSEKYQQAKDRVLFKGFYKEFNAVISPSGGYLDIGNLRYKTIETIVESKLELTETAIKQIGL